MTNRINISVIIEVLQDQIDESITYFDRQTGQVVAITEEEMSLAESDASEDVVTDWQRENIEIARRIKADTEGRFEPLPNRFEVHEWDIMRRFAEEVTVPDISESLLRAIHGRGAFRCFKDRLHELGVADQWYAYRDAALRQIAVDWCRENDIEWIETSPDAEKTE